MSAGYARPVCKGDWALGTACRLCERCIANRPSPSPPPPMRRPHAPCAPSIGSLLIVMVFLLGVVVGSKMVGGW